MNARQNSNKKPEVATLRRPIQVVKKRSGPLDKALAELNEEAGTSKNAIFEENVFTEKTKVEAGSEISKADTILKVSCRRLSHGKEKDKRRERWLLTRKTWKYMTDAGRKLIPDGAMNRKDDISKIETHFQKVCSSETRFILWRRKASFPGAGQSSKRRLKLLSRHSGQKPFTPLNFEQTEREEANNTDKLIDLLQSHLKLDECTKTTTLLCSKTVRPDQTASPSAHRPNPSNSNCGKHFQDFLHPQVNNDPLRQLSEIDQLLQRLRMLQQNEISPIAKIFPEMITHKTLEDKAFLKNIYHSLKKQQLHRILHTHSNNNYYMSNLPLSNSFSMSNLTSCNNDNYSSSLSGKSKANFQKEINNSNNEIVLNASGHQFAFRRSPPKSLDLVMSSHTNTTSRKSDSKKQLKPKKNLNSCGSQTTFIQLQEIKRIAELYKTKREEEDSIVLGEPNCTDDELDKTTNTLGQQTSRKCSVDNEDVSQSVSDTIKRYLRMARKKSVHDGNGANRFKRVNYDRNLRNIRAKGEIKPPGVDEDNSKAVQTLDAWALIQLDFIHGKNSGILERAHIDWQNSLDDRIRKITEFEMQSSTQKSNSSFSAPTSPTSPTSSSDKSSVKSFQTLQYFSQISPTEKNMPANTTGGLLHSGSQFFSNLWHGSSSRHREEDLLKGSMQKSKSSTNVGQFVTRKMLKNRSNSQTRPLATSASSKVSKWAPAGNLIWVSEDGERLTISDTYLYSLSNTENKYLQRIAIEKLNELNIGIDVSSVGLERFRISKIEARRVLQKRKALTTGLFDSGKKNGQSELERNIELIEPENRLQ